MIFFPDRPRDSIQPGPIDLFLGVVLKISQQWLYLHFTIALSWAFPSLQMVGVSYQMVSFCSQSTPYSYESLY